MTKYIASRALPIVLLAGLWTSSNLSAQVDIREDKADRRVRCSAAETALERRESQSSVIDALHLLARCERSGGAVLAGVWLAGPRPGRELDILTYSSRSLVDARIMEAVTTVAEDDKADLAARIAAVVVLASYIEPSIAGIRQNWEREYAEERLGIIWNLHASQTAGVQPLPEDHTRIIMERLARIEEASSDWRVRAVAQYVGRYLLRSLEVK
jgi:hypothetical protein